MITCFNYNCRLKNVLRLKKAFLMVQNKNSNLLHNCWEEKCVLHLQFLFEMLLMTKGLHLNIIHSGENVEYAVNVHSGALHLFTTQESKLWIFESWFELQLSDLLLLEITDPRLLTNQNWESSSVGLEQLIINLLPIEDDSCLASSWSLVIRVHLQSPYFLPFISSCTSNSVFCWIHNNCAHVCNMK